MDRLLPEEIETERLRLRAPALTDSETIFRAYAQDPEVCRYMIWVPHDSEVVTRRFIAACIEAWQGGNRMPYVITKRRSDEPIGMLEARVQGTALDIGYVLARRHWGSSLMPEAIPALTSASLSRPSIFRV